MAKKRVEIKREKVGKAMQKKLAQVDSLASKLAASPVVALIDLHNFPAKNMTKLRKELRGKVEIIVTKKSVIKFALQKSGKKIQELEKHLGVQPALVFSKENPFKLYKMTEKLKTPERAKAGKVSPKDIVVPEGDTGLPPGPAIGNLQKANLPAKIQKGKIVIEKAMVVTKAGEVISKDVAEALITLGMEPFETQLNVVAALEDGTIYSKEILAIDEAQVAAQFSTAAAEAFNLAVYAVYLTSETIRPLLQKAEREARALSTESGFPTKETVPSLLAKAAAQASSLSKHVGGA